MPENILLDEMQKIVDDGKKLQSTCRECGVKNPEICQDRDCQTFDELVVQLVLVRKFTEMGFLKPA